MRRAIAVVAGLLLCLPAGLRAGDVKRHQNKQQKRIEKGEKSGRLTSDEAAKIDSKQQAIEQEREAAAADGKMTKQEHKSIRHEQKEANKQIHGMKDNKQKDKTP